MRATCRRACSLLGALVDVQVEGLEAEAAVAAASDEIATVHALFTFHVKDSELQVIDHAVPGERLIVDFRILAVLCLVAELYIVSERVFDCRISPSNLFTDERLPIFFDGDTVAKETCVYMDPGGIAKGFAVGCVTEVLHIFAVERAIVSAGGDPRHHGV